MKTFIGLAVSCYEGKDEVGDKDENLIPTAFNTVEDAYREIADTLQEYYRQISDGERNWDERISEDEYYPCVYKELVNGYYMAYEYNETAEDFCGHYLFTYQPTKEEYSWR